jgi:hypothetical protein
MGDAAMLAWLMLAWRNEWIRVAVALSGGAE